MSPLRSLPLALSLLTLFAWAGCSRSGPAARTAPPVPVQVAKVECRTLPRTQLSIGTVQALRSVAVKSQVDGLIQQIHFREGQIVRAGDLLVSLDPRPQQNALRIARADLATARAEAAKAASDLERYERLKQSDNVSPEQYNQYLTKRATSDALVQAKEAAVANAELLLSYTSIRAPFEGRTGQHNLHEGALVRANDAASSLLTLHQLSPIEVAFSIPEPLLADLRSALAAGPVSVKVTRRSGPGSAIEGRLSFVDNNVDPTTGTITLKAEFANADQALWPGQFVDVETVLGADANALLVPIPAVQAGQQGPQLFVVKPDRTVELRRVTVGRTAAGFALLTTGVKADETVVTDGQLRLVPGSAVTIRTLEEVTSGAARTPRPSSPAPSGGKTQP